MTRLLVRLLVSLLLAAGLLAWMVRGMLVEHVPDGHTVWSVLLDEFARVPPLALLAYLASFVVVHLARMLRWSAQVSALGERDWRLLMRVAAIGYAAIVLFPLRTGEVVRPYLLARESSKVTFAAALGTAVTERIIDGLLITGLLFAAVATAPQPASALVRNAGWVSGAVFTSATFGLALFVWQRPLATRLLHATVGRLSRGVALKLEAMMSGFVDGVSSLRRGGTLLQFLGMTVVYWTANALGIWMLAHAFHIDVPIWAGFGLLAVLVVGIMLPAGPGFLGNFQLFLTEGLKLWVPAASVVLSGFAFALAMNVLQLGVMVLFAVPFLATSGLTVRGLVQLQQSAERAG